MAQTRSPPRRPYGRKEPEDLRSEPLFRMIGLRAKAQAIAKGGDTGLAFTAADI